MVSLKQATTNSAEPAAVSPRISFSADFLDEDEGFISLIPNSGIEVNHERAHHRLEFEFRSIKPSNDAMTAADELFSDGRLLPIWQIHNFKKLNEISLRTEENTETGNKSKNKAEEIINTNAVSFCFLEDDPSPRPPKCTVLWKELLKLRKQRASSSSSMPPNTGESKERKTSKEKEVKRVRKGLERSTRAKTLPTCSNGKNAGREIRQLTD